MTTFFMGGMIFVPDWCVVPKSVILSGAKNLSVICYDNGVK
jgi:hypothetical protein